MFISVIIILLALLYVPDIIEAFKVRPIYKKNLESLKKDNLLIFSYRGVIYKYEIQTTEDLKICYIEDVESKEWKVVEEKADLPSCFNYLLRPWKNYRLEGIKKEIYTISSILMEEEKRLNSNHRFIS